MSTENEKPDHLADGQWFRVANAAVECFASLGQTAAVVYCVLGRYADASGRCFPSIKTIAAKVGVKPRAIQIAVRTLVEAKMIVVESRSSEAGKTMSNTYRLLPLSANGKGVSGCAHPSRRVFPETGGGRTTVRDRGVPGCAHKKTKGKKTSLKRSKGGNVDQIKDSEITDIADRIFRKINYTGNEGGNVWKIAGAFHFGKLSEAEINDAANGCRECSTRNPASFFYTILSKNCEGRGVDLKALLASVRVIPRLPQSPPEAANYGGDLAEQMKSKSKSV